LRAAPVDRNRRYIAALCPDVDRQCRPSSRTRVNQQRDAEPKRRGCNQHSHRGAGDAEREGIEPSGPCEGQGTRLDWRSVRLPFGALLDHAGYLVIFNSDPKHGVFRAHVAEAACHGPGFVRTLSPILRAIISGLHGHTPSTTTMRAGSHGSNGIEHLGVWTCGAPGEYRSAL
jgi:hypothetical protein